MTLLPFTLALWVSLITMDVTKISFHIQIHLNLFIGFADNIKKHFLCIITIHL